MSRDHDPRATETYGPPADSADSDAGSAAASTAASSSHRAGSERLPALRSSFDRGEILGRYLVLDRLGSGGMGVVYTAYDPQLDRKVALKLLRIKVIGRQRRREAHQRLVREAQALARLNHPNVVAVHDIGEVGDRIFLAMEYVEGQDLKAWLAQQERTWQQIVETFVQAGKGLAAAHDAGLLHRDFKPANVLLGLDGRARVLDFGLARPVRDPEPESHPPTRSSSALSGSERAAKAEQHADDIRGSSPWDDSTASTEGPPVAAKAVSARPGPAGSAAAIGSSSNISVGALDAQLTRTGSFLGTLAYMSPEQIDGRVDPRSDQFSFCVALYEALWRQSPFIDRGGVLKRAMQSNIRQPPRTGDVPLWLEQAVMRGLRVDPDERYPSMNALLTALQPQPKAKLRGLVAGLLMLAGLMFVLFQHNTVVPCANVDDPIQLIWNGARRAQLAKGFASSPLPYADALGKRASSLLDAYADEWSDMRRETCEATRVEGTQSEALLDLRMSCLDQRLQELDSLLELIFGADHADPWIQQSVEAFSNLPYIGQCADTRSLLTVVPPANDQESERVFRIKKELTRIDALLSLRQKDEAYQAVQALEPDLEQIRHDSTLAQAFQLTAFAAFMNDQRQEAIDAHLKAIAHADAGRDDRARAVSLNSLIWAFDTEPAKAAPWVEAARGAVERSGSGRLSASWHQAKARYLFRSGETQAALETAERATELAKKHNGPDHLYTARILIDLGNAQLRSELYDAAYASFSEAHRIQILNLGTNHPDLAASNFYRAITLDRLKRFEEALDLLVQSLRTMEATFGPEHSRIAEYLIGLGDVYWHSGNKPAALSSYQRASEIKRKHYGDRAPVIAPILNNISLIHWESGELETAEKHLREALDIYRSSLGAEHPQVLISQTNLARVLLHRDRPQEAARLLQAAWQSSNQVSGPRHTTSLNSGLALGEAQLALGEVEQAETQIRAIAELIATKDPAAEDWLLGALSFAQARLAVSLGQSTAAAGHSAEAERIFKRMGDSGSYSLSRWRSWHAQHLP